MKQFHLGPGKECKADFVPSGAATRSIANNAVLMPNVKLGTWNASIGSRNPRLPANPRSPGQNNHRGQEAESIRQVLSPGHAGDEHDPEPAVRTSMRHQGRNIDRNSISASRPAVRLYHEVAVSTLAA